MMFPFTFDTGFWFCESANDAPCRILCRALFDHEFPLRFLVILVTFLFLALIQILFYACCAICPYLICQCYSNPPQSWFVYDDDDDLCPQDGDKKPRTRAETKRRMKMSDRFVYWNVPSDPTNDSSEEFCPICLGNFEINERMVKSRRCPHAFHEDCLSTWLCRQSTCACCRMVVLKVEDYR